VLYQNVGLQHLPVVAVPTTCGTGSEVTPYAVLTRQELHTKQSISHLIFPELALVDGKYLKNAPLSVIANTAVDALGHMLESYFHARATDYSRMLCQYAMEVWASASGVLLGMEAEPEAYEQLMFASSLAGMAIAHTSTGIPHGLSYYLTCQKGIPHGKAVGRFLPGYLSVLPEEYEMQVMMALRALGFGSIEQFEGFLKEVLGPMELTEDEKTEMVEQMAQNEKKLAAMPCEVTKEMLYRMCQ
jgi:alcohol dehydrogenase